MQKIKLKTMSDLTLKKESTHKVGKVILKNSTKKRQLVFIKPFLMLMVLITFIILSLENDSLFLKEILVSGGILFLVFIIHLISKTEPSRNY